MKKLLLAILLFAGLIPASAYTDLDTGMRVFLTRDPAGFTDGPNLYTYVHQNPWTHFDPEGLYPDAQSMYSPRNPEEMKAYQQGSKQASITAVAAVPFMAIGVEGLPVARVGMLGRAAYIGLQAGGAGATSHAIASGLNGQVPTINGMNSSAALSAPLGAGGSMVGDVTAALSAPKLSLNSGSVTQPYGELAPGLSGTGVQANHINQNAAYGSVIPKDQGVSLPMPGNAITDVGSAHYDFHASMEDFWNPYRAGGDLEGLRPTNADYLQAAQKSLQNAGVPTQTAKQATQEAAAQQQQYGLQPTDPVPRVPGKLNQAQPTPPPNAPPVPPGKS